MVTNREFEDVVKQVNVMFDKLNKKIDKLEKQIKLKQLDSDSRE